MLSLFRIKHDIIKDLRLGGLLGQEALEYSDISLLSPAVRDVGGGCG